MFDIGPAHAEGHDLCQKLHVAPPILEDVPPTVIVYMLFRL